MKLFPHSKNVSKVDFLNAILAVDFKSGSRYEYDGVPAHLYEGLCASTSPGSYLREHIINPTKLDGSKLYPARRIQ